MDRYEICVLLGVALYTVSVFPSLRYRLRKWRSRNWPAVLGSVQRGHVRRGGPTRFQAFAYRSILGYSYLVNGSAYLGFFVIIARDQKAAENLQTQCNGKSVTVKYDPQNPGISVLVESELLGRSLLQNPLWVD